MAKLGYEYSDNTLIWQTGVDLDAAFPYWIKQCYKKLTGFKPKTKDYEKRSWCVHTFGSPADPIRSGWHEIEGVFYFMREEDRTMFMLRWCN